MIQISFISTGTTVSQTPIMASICYNLVNRWVKEANRDPEFPVACIYDFSNMYSTLQYFATDKMLTRLNELTSIVDVMKSTKGIDFDWSLCTFPSKFAHKRTKDPLFFVVPIFPRGMTSDMTKDEIVELAKILNHIAESIANADCQYVIYDLPIIDTMSSNLTVIPALVNSNYIISVIDCQKPSYQALENELKSLIGFIEKTNRFTTPELKINGLILTHISEKVKTENWVENLEQTFHIPIIGKIREDSHFTSVSSKYEIPTEEKHVKKLKYFDDFNIATEELNKNLQTDSSLRKITGKQIEVLEKKIYSSY